MIAHFHIHYRTVFGEQIAIKTNKSGKEETLTFQTYDGANWNVSIPINENENFSYKYILQSPQGNVEEYGKYRQLDLSKSTAQIFVQDQWRATSNENNIFLSAAFSDVILKREKSIAAKKDTKIKGNCLIFNLQAPSIPKHLSCGIIGDGDFLGNWAIPVRLDSDDFPHWKTSFDIPSTLLQFTYKYVLLNEKNQIVVWEEGENRTCSFAFSSEKGNTLVRSDDGFRLSSSQGRWRGAGVAIPVFSLRSEKSLGIGEFTDLKPMADWAAATGLKVVQILPVNDTIATKTWLDSYPYAAISVFALHPLYVNIQSIAKLKDKTDEKRLNEAILKLNALETVDFEAVLEYKFSFFKILFQQEKKEFFKDKDVQKFLNDNTDWLKSYAAFCYLRDVNATCNFNDWKKHNVFSQTVIEEICNENAKHFDEVALYYFIQYHAHKQLLETTNYARSKEVVLKGDLPIGIYRHSADAWVAPHLYNMNGQAGAPPDAYAEGGQNWGFPTYNWEIMAKDDFAWWKGRMSKLAEYFDALRIDHILGFFRIWQIPIEQVEGTLGLFNPRLPYGRDELASEGIYGNLDRYTKPYIRGYHLGEIFGNEADFVRNEFLNDLGHQYFGLKENVNTQQKIKQLFLENKKYSDKKHLEKALMRLLGEVLLIEEPGSNGNAFNPRITINTTRSYKELEGYQRSMIDRLYGDYFFTRHDEYWKQQAFWKLPALLNATNMLICAEDLGMIPNSVPGVMKDLNIITLEIQRMPKGATSFGETEHYPYMTVCSPSCHDMSTVRGWWEGDHRTAQNFWNSSMKQYGEAPKTCTPGIVEHINQQHLASQSVLAIFPIQDFLGMDAKLRRVDAKAEQINEPSNPQHYWRFRFHIPLEKLLEEKELNEKIKNMVAASGR
jgi:4-alpha-glucanotransferase